jgi:hypothetical protein
MASYVSFSRTAPANRDEPAPLTFDQFKTPRAKMPKAVAPSESFLSVWWYPGALLVVSVGAFLAVWYL